MNVIPVEVKKKCIELSNSGLNSRQVYTEYFSKLYDTSYKGFRTMLQRWRKKTFADTKLLESGNLGYGFAPHATTVQLNSEGQIIQSWIKSRSDDSLYLELIDNIKNLPSFEPIKKIPIESTGHMLEIPLYDMHFGIADFEYYHNTLSDILEIIESKQYREINIIIGQDLFHNDDFRGRTASGKEIQKINVRQAYNDALRFYHEVINKALEHSDKVNLVYSVGNHDESMSWCFVKTLQAQYSQLNVNDSFKPRKIITFGNNFIGITHGDNSKAKPIDLRSQFSIEYPLEFANAKVREIHCGHLHTEFSTDSYGVMVRRLSTGNKTDDWHETEGYVGNHKRFMVFGWTLEKLEAIYYV